MLDALEQHEHGATLFDGRPVAVSYTHLTLLRVDAAINKKYRHADGTEMTISRVCWDTGGIDGEIVYQRSKMCIRDRCQWVV